MCRRPWVGIMTLYALRPDSETGSLEDAEVVDQLRYGWEFLEQAVAVWRLVDTTRANQIKKSPTEPPVPPVTERFASIPRISTNGCECSPESKRQSSQRVSSPITGVPPPIAWRNWPNRCRPWISSLSVRLRARRVPWTRS